MSLLEFFFLNVEPNPDNMNHLGVVGTDTAITGTEDSYMSTSIVSRPNGVVDSVDLQGPTMKATSVSSDSSSGSTGTTTTMTTTATATQTATQIFHPQMLETQTAPATTDMSSTVHQPMYADRTTPQIAPEMHQVIQMERGVRPHLYPQVKNVPSFLGVILN